MGQLKRRTPTFSSIGCGQAAMNATRAAMTGSKNIFLFSSSFPSSLVIG
jgi:hypothetical protein